VSEGKERKREGKPLSVCQGKRGKGGGRTMGREGKAEQNCSDSTAREKGKRSTWRGRRLPENRKTKKKKKGGRQR